MHLESPWRLQLLLENPWISVLTLSNPKEKEQDLQDKLAHVVDWTNKDMGSFLHWMESFKNGKCALENHCKVLEFLFRIGYKPHVCSVIWELLKKGVGERVGDLLNLHCTLYTVHCQKYIVSEAMKALVWNSKTDVCLISISEISNWSKLAIFKGVSKLVPPAWILLLG